ncbi:MAG: hypothetical protein H0W48_00160 [Methylibium sp.]|nr:hypothetical protein [Methylibium sp.]
MKRTECLPARVRAFFQANPDEELTHAQLVAKFDANKRNAKHVVAWLVASGELEVAHVIRPRAMGARRDS